MVALSGLARWIRWGRRCKAAVGGRATTRQSEAASGVGALMAGLGGDVTSEMALVGCPSVGGDGCETAVAAGCAAAEGSATAAGTTLWVSGVPERAADTAPCVGRCLAEAE